MIRRWAFTDTATGRRVAAPAETRHRGGDTYGLVLSTAGEGRAALKSKSPFYCDRSLSFGHDAPRNARNARAATFPLGTLLPHIRLIYQRLRLRDSSVEQKVEDLAFEEIDLRDGATLERDRPYLVPLVEELRLPDDVPT
jgi:hypothetical protein